MKKNYLKVYFKSFGIIATLGIFLAFLAMGILFYQFNDQIKDWGDIVYLVRGVLVCMMFGGALVGFSSLKSEKIGTTDFLRVSFLASSLGLGIVAVINMGTAGLLPVIAYFLSAALYIVEIVIRAMSITRDDVSAGMGAYFGAIGYRFNPLILSVLGIVVAVIFSVLGKVTNNFSALDSVHNSALLGVGAAVVIALLLSGTDKEADVSLLDALLIVLFLGSLYSIGAITLETEKHLFLIYVILLGVSTGGLLIRSCFYSQADVYDNTRHRTSTYYRCVFTRYSIIAAVLVGLVACLSFGESMAYASKAGKLYEYTNIIFNNPDPDLVTMVCSIIPIAIIVILTALIFVFRHFDSTECEKVDWVLTADLVAAGFGIPFLVSAAILGQFSTALDQIFILVAAAVAAVAFIVAAVIQIIRIKNFDIMAKQLEIETAQMMKDKKDAKAAEKQKAEEEEREKKKNEPYDPFALTEEDEALYEATYGKDEKKEEEPKAEEPAKNPYEEEEEPATEEATEEETTEENAEETPSEEATEEPAQSTDEADDFDAFVNGMSEKKNEEAPAEEPATEEAQPEEAPAEAQSEEAQSEDAEDSEDEDSEEDETEDDDDADEEEEPEEGEEASEEALPEEKAKEADIQVQEFVAVDEDGTPKKIKRKFNTKMMFAPYETKEYYNEIKNYLCMYRAKGRNSSRCETFRYKGLVAKVALGGKALKVFLALDPAIIDQYPKYHLKNVSEKKQYAEVPVMIKVRSDRSLKYFKELVDLMFASRLVKPKKNFEASNYLPQMIPNGEAILANLGMSTYYLQNTMNVNGIPEEMPDNLIDYLPCLPGEELEEEEKEAVVYLDTLCAHFEEGDEITLDVLKSLHVCQEGNVLRVKARGTLDRKLIVYAEYFDEDALQMLMCTNGTAVHIVR